VSHPPEPPPRRFGLRGRIGALATIAGFLLLGVIGVVLERVSAERIHAEARSRAGALLESLSVPCAIDVATGAIERLDDALTELARAGHAQLGLVHVAMLDDRGFAIAHSSHGSFPSRARAGATEGGLDRQIEAFVAQAVASDVARWRYLLDDGGHPQLLVSMPAVSGIRWGTLVGTFELLTVRDRIAWNRRVIAGGVLGLALALALALYLGLSMLLVRPVRRLSSVLTRLESGDLSARADVVSSDELGDLARGFNAMAAELESYTRDLERRVSERSEEARHKHEALEAANRRLEEVAAEMTTLARTDALTGLCNRRHFFELFERELGRVARHGNPLTLAMLDVDHFKQFNDTYGHQVGDEVLRVVAETLLRAARSSDVVARYGGEEFVVLLVETPADQGVAAIERLCRAVREAPLTTPDGEPIPTAVTLSAGVVALPEDEADADELLRRADEALYAAKEGGRDRVVRWRRGAGEDHGAE